MKQTPIPEKLYVSKDIFLNEEYKTEETINSLIDVLTEQQKEIDELRKEHDSLGDANENLAWDIEKRLQKLEPYTSMRSTGELKKECEHSWIQDSPIKVCYHCGYKPIKPQEYCECKDRSISGGVCSICHKPIKPKEDVKKKLKTYLTNNIGLNNNLEFIAANILAIVKGK